MSDLVTPPADPARPDQPDYSRPDPALLAGDVCPACGKRHACPAYSTQVIEPPGGLGRYSPEARIPCTGCGTEHYRVLTRTAPVGPIVLGTTSRALVVMSCPVWEPRPPSQVRGAGILPQQAEEGRAPAPPPCAGSDLTFLPGAFEYRGYRQRLRGKPLEVLRELWVAPGRTRTASDLLDAIWPDTAVTWDAVRSAVSKARRALREAVRVAGVEGPADPIPNVDRGTHRLAWRLDLP
jgi:hypothetical protein